MKDVLAPPHLDLYVDTFVQYTFCRISLCLVSYMPLAPTAFRRAKREYRELLRTVQDIKLSFAATSSSCHAFGSFSSARTQPNPTDSQIGTNLRSFAVDARTAAQTCTAIAVDARTATKNVTTTPTPSTRRHDTCPARRPRRLGARRRPAKQPEERRLGRRRPVASWFFCWW